jgi:alkaline phosphatase
MRNLLILVIILQFCACKTTQPETIYIEKEVLAPREQTKTTAKNIILLIGDGMGMGQISAGTYASNNKTNLERFPVIGIHKPTASSHLVTDSAAAATAFACGVKTFNKAIGVDRDSIPVTSILEEAETKNLRTGLVATSTIVHATPAAFIAHNVDRRAYEEIAEDFLATDVDFFAGGGKQFFDLREDERNLIKEMEAKGYVIETFLSEYTDVKMRMEGAEKFGYLSSNKDPLPRSQGRDYFEDMSMTAVNFLNNSIEDRGFFLMIESSQIDWGGHANESNYIIDEFQEFDRVIGKVLDWAEQDGETLVIVTADHETGGYAVHHEATIDNLITNFTSKKHTGDFIPVFAKGPGAEDFAGIYENYDIYYKMRAAFGWPAKTVSSSK